METESLNIRENTILMLGQHAVPYNSQLPLVDKLPVEQWKTAQQIARRLVILYALTGLSHDADPKKLLTWIKSESLDDEILDCERQYFVENDLSHRAIANLSWNQESLFALAWCLGLQSDLPFPDHEANLSPIFSKIPPKVSASQFIAQAKRIEHRKILQEADLNYCYHWSIRHPEIWDRQISLSLDVVLERRRALEWVIGRERFGEIALDT